MPVAEPTSSAKWLGPIAVLAALVVVLSVWLLRSPKAVVTTTPDAGAAVVAPPADAGPADAGRATPDASTPDSGRRKPPPPPPVEEM